MTDVLLSVLEGKCYLQGKFMQLDGAQKEFSICYATLLTILYLSIIKPCPLIRQTLNDVTRKTPKNL